MRFARVTILAAALFLISRAGALSAQASTPIVRDARSKTSILADVNAGLTSSQQAKFAAWLNGSSRKTAQEFYDYARTIARNERSPFALFLLKAKPRDRDFIVHQTGHIITMIEAARAERIRQEGYLSADDRKALKPQPAATVLAEVKAQLSPDECAGLDRLLNSLPAKSQSSFVEFVGALSSLDEDERTGKVSRSADEEGAFVSHLLELDPGQRANIVGFIVGLDGDQQREIAEMITEPDYYGQSQWENFFAFVGSTTPATAFGALFQVDPMGKVLASINGGDPEGPLWIWRRPNKDGDGHSCIAEFDPAVCSWSFEPLEPGVSNGKEAPKIPWQVEIYRTGDAAGAKYDESDLRYEQENYGAVRSDEERDEDCGGVLLPDNWVLTAAHCILTAGKPRTWILGNRRVRTGTNSLKSGGTTWKIAAVVMHGAYDSKTVRNDIALLKIEADKQTNLAENGDAHSIALPPLNAPVVDGTKLLLTGWGMTGEMAIGGLRDVHGNARTKSLQLLEATLTKVPLDECNNNRNYIHEHYRVAPGQICALGKHNQDACYGDSGGPLVHQVGHWARLVGVVSFGPGCGLDGTPGVYTDVAYYRSWIDDATKQAKLGEVLAWPLANQAVQASGYAKR